MPDMPRPCHFDTDICGRRNHFLWQQRANRSAFSTPFCKVSTTASALRCGLMAAAPFSVSVASRKEHELRALHRAPFSTGTDANVFRRRFASRPEPLTLDRLNVLRAPD